MCKHFIATLVGLFLAVHVLADEKVSPEEIEVMVERYVLGMGKAAKKLLQDSGMASSDIDRIAAELSAAIRSCTYTSIAEDAAGPVDVEASNAKVELRVREAFENAGIRSPF